MRIKYLSILFCFFASFKLIGYDFQPIVLLYLVDNGKSFRDAAFSPDGTKILLSRGSGFEMWDANTGIRLLDLKRDHAHSRISVEHPIAIFSPDGTKILANLDNNDIKVWDAQTGAFLFGTTPLINRREYIMSATFSPDSKKIVTTSSHGNVRLWNAHTGIEILNLAGLNGYVQQATFSPDGTKLVTIESRHDGQPSVAKVWDVVTGVQIISLPSLPGIAFSSAVFSPDSTKILAILGRLAKVWDATTGTELFSLAGHERWIAHALFSPDGSKILTSSADFTAKVWDAATGIRLLNLPGHAYTVTSASFSTDGKKVLAASPEYYRTGRGTAKVWDAVTGIELYNINALGENINSAKFSPDGSQVVIASDGTHTVTPSGKSPPPSDRPAEIWLLPPDDLVNPQTLKMTTYAKLIKGFMATNETKDYGHYILYLHKQNPQNTIAKTWQSEKIIFDSLNSPAQKYLRKIIPGRPH